MDSRSTCGTCRRRSSFRLGGIVSRRAFLRTAWLNLDWAWAGALVVTGIAVLMW